jgi:hypothetical protein
MRLLLSLLLGSALTFPVWADPAPINPNIAYTLTSVSTPGWVLAEVNSLCLLSPPGKVAPLRLKIVQSLVGPKCVSLESATDEGYFLRHQDSQLKLHPYAENDWVFARDASFYLVHNNDGSVSFRSYNYSKQYITVTASKEIYISTDPELPYRSFMLTN